MNVLSESHETPQGTILVVDDEPGVLLTIQAILAQEGYAVDGAPSGMAAIEIARARTYDLVLTDLRLGDLDGLEVLAEVRRISPRTVGMVLTGYASLESAIQAMREGAYDYLVKPTDVEELKLRVAHVFERHRLTDELKRRVAELEAANTTIDHMNASLRSRIDAATAQLRAHVDELSRTQAELEAARAQKEQFIAMVAHELRSPLTPLRFATQLIDRQPVANDAIRRYTATIEDQVDRLERLIQDLLDVSRIDNGRFSIQPEECDLTALTQKLVESYRQRHTDRRFTLDAPDDPLVEIFDCGRLEQALNNLLDNAVKYSFPDTTVTLALAVRPDNWIDLSVADEGMGIPSDQMQQIFEPFRRLDAARDTQGFGLGLAIAKGIAEAHGGHLSVTSETPRARGAVFTISLPLTAREE